MRLWNSRPYLPSSLKAEREFQSSQKKYEDTASKLEQKIQDLTHQIAEVEKTTSIEALKAERVLGERDVALNRVRTLENEVTDGHRRVADRDEK